MIAISVVIPSYNAQDSLPGTLAALQAQQFEQEFEVIVMDCSDHDKVPQLCEQFEHCRCIQVAERFNPGIGRNLGAEQAKGELLVFVDADVVLEPNALAEAWRYYQQGHSIFGGALELNEQAEPTIASYLEHYFFNHESQRGRPVCPRSNLSSALMLFDRALFLSEGRFKDIPRMQDTELTERMIASGHTLSFNPNVVGLQIQDSPMHKVLRKIYINGKNLYFIRYQKQSFLKKVFLFLLLPLLTLLKIIRISARHLRYQDGRGRFITIALTPLLLLAGVYWAGGLYRSMIFGGEISRNRD